MLFLAPKSLRAQTLSSLYLSVLNQHVKVRKVPPSAFLSLKKAASLLGVTENQALAIIKTSTIYHAVCLATDEIRVHPDAPMKRLISRTKKLFKQTILENEILSEASPFESVVLE